MTSRTVNCIVHRKAVSVDEILRHDTFASYCEKRYQEEGSTNSREHRSSKISEIGFKNQLGSIRINVEMIDLNEGKSKNLSN